MDINITIDTKNIQISNIKFQKMLLIFNALEEGWKKEKMLIFFLKNMKVKKKYY